MAATPRPPLRSVHFGDDLYACQPVCQAMLDAGGDFLLACKPSSCKTLCEHPDGTPSPPAESTPASAADDDATAAGG